MGPRTRGLPPPVGPSPYLEHMFPQGHHLMPAGARAQSSASSAQGWGEQTQDSSSLQPSQGFLFPTKCAEQSCGCRGQEPCVLGVRQACQVESRDLRQRHSPALLCGGRHVSWTEPCLSTQHPSWLQVSGHVSTGRGTHWRLEALQWQSSALSRDLVSQKCCILSPTAHRPSQQLRGNPNFHTQGPGGHRMDRKASGCSLMGMSPQPAQATQPAAWACPYQLPAREHKTCSWGEKPGLDSQAPPTSPPCLDIKM